MLRRIRDGVFREHVILASLKTAALKIWLALELLDVTTKGTGCL